MSEPTFFEAKKTLQMVNTPVTEIQKLIGRKWFLSPGLLAKRAGVGKDIIADAIRGKKLPYSSEQKLKKFLEEYKGEFK